MIDPLAYFGGTDIYWHAIFFGVAILAAILISWGLRVCQSCKSREQKYAMWLTTPMGMLLGVLVARGLYCYFMPEILENNAWAFFDFASGGFMLFGAIIGVVIAAVLTKVILKDVYVTELLDAMAPAAALAICIGRMGSYFSGEDQGVIIASEKWQFFPFAIYNGAEGYWHLAVFSFEVLAAAIAFVASVAMFIIVYTGKKSYIARGSVLVTFLLVFSSSQALLESMRNDSVYLITLGFVRFNQIASAIILLGCFIFANVKTIKKFGFKFWLPILWVLVGAGFGIAFYKEFRLTSGTLVPSYTVMGICLLAICIISFVLLCMTLNPERQIRAAEEKSEEPKKESEEKTEEKTEEKSEEKTEEKTEPVEAEK